MTEDLDLLQRSVKEPVAQMILAEVASPKHSNEIAQQIREWQEGSRPVAEFGFNTNRDDASTLWEYCHAAVADWDEGNPGLLLVRDDSPPDVRIAHGTSEKPTSIGFWRTMNQLREKWEMLPSQTVFLVTRQQYFFLTTEADHFKRWIPLKLHLLGPEENGQSHIASSTSRDANALLTVPLLSDDFDNIEGAQQSWNAYHERLRRACERGESPDTLARRYYLPLMAAAIALKKWEEATNYNTRIESVGLSKVQRLLWLRLCSHLQEEKGNITQAVATAEERLRLAEELEIEKLGNQPQKNQEPPWNVLGAVDELFALHKRQKNFDDAEHWLLYGLEVAPKQEVFLDNYAKFLRSVRKDYDKAEEFYLRAVEAAPDNGGVLSNYANFLTEERKEQDDAEEYFRRSIQASPQNAVVLGNYALFLAHIRQDFNRAEELFQRAIVIDPTQAYILGGYAILLKNFRQDYEKADEYFRRSIEADPNDIVTLRIYSLFLCIECHNVERAMPYLRRAVEITSEDPQDVINYAAALLIQGQNNEGKTMLDRAATMPDLTDKQQVGIAFHRYIHFPEEMPSPLKALKQVLKDGKRAADWTFDLNIERAQPGGHPNTKLLKALAEVIVEKKSLKTLNVFPEWISA